MKEVEVRMMLRKSEYNRLGGSCAESRPKFSRRLNPDHVLLFYSPLKLLHHHYCTIIIIIISIIIEYTSLRLITSSNLDEYAIFRYQESLQV